MAEQSAPTLVDEIEAVRAVIEYLNDTKPRDRTPKYERTITAMRAVLNRLLAIKPEGEC